MDTEAEPRHVSMRAYVLTYASLLVLATVSWLVAVLHVPGAVILAIAIGALKAVLVLAYFMHLAEEGFSFKLSIAAAAVMVLIFIGLTVLDPLTRGRDTQLVDLKPADENTQPF
ncbi:MAG TPA: cytochrome C oxidase subunit IV family protein [Polyangiales bacterium]|nr:cytochrome C oxidase subunit IV family protein [Polyangiales bacterium]